MRQKRMYLQTLA